MLNFAIKNGITNGINHKKKQKLTNGKNRTELHKKAPLSSDNGAFSEWESLFFEDLF